jgi:hypothetical protein
MDELVGGLAEGKSQIVLLPRVGAPEGLLDELDRRIYSLPAGPGFLCVDPACVRKWDVDHVSAETLAAGLADSLGLQRSPGQRFGPSDLAEHDDLEKSVIFVDISDASSLESIWFEFLEAYATASTGVSPVDRSVIVTIARPENVSHVPVSDIALRSSWWWGIIGPLDCAVFVDFMFHPSANLAAEIVEVARWDLDMAKRLSQLNNSWRGVKSVEEFFEAIDFETLVPESNEIQEPIRGPHVTSRGPGELIGKWHRGEVNWWRGRADEHIAVTKNLQVRRWTGQLSVIFPYLEQLRIAIGMRLYNEAVQIRRETDLDGKPVHELELGPMLLWQTDVLPSTDSRLREVLRCARDARNRLAHSDPLTLASLQQLVGLAKAANVVVGEAVE